MKLREKRCFKLSVSVTIRVERFEDLVEAFKEKSPESVDWAVAAHETCNVC